MRILVIEDDTNLAQTLKMKLGETFVVDVSNTGLDGAYKAKTDTYNLIILDLVLPDVAGLNVCRDIREKKKTMPILVLTAEDGAERKVDLLDAGADDYLTKPFNFNELHARVRALLRRPAEVLIPNPLTVGDIVLDTTRRTVIRRDRALDLRKREFDLLEFLMRRAGEAVTRGMILENVWETDIDPLTNTVDVHINYLRDKVDRPFGTKIIKTVPGVGYKLEI